MAGWRDLERFIERAKGDPDVASQLSDCSVDQWGDSHLPLDIDLQRVIDLAAGYGYLFERSDVIASQCRHLQDFSLFEMENSFVARRYLSRIQMQLERDGALLPGIDYYRY